MSTDFNTLENMGIVTMLCPDYWDELGDDSFKFDRTHKDGDAWRELEKIQTQLSDAVASRKTVALTFSVLDGDGIMELLEVCEFRYEHEGAVLGVTKFDLHRGGADD